VPHAAPVSTLPVAAKAPEVSGESPRHKAMRSQEKTVFALQADAPPCSTCGSIMVRNGACYKCLNCGGTSGCS